MKPRAFAFAALGLIAFACSSDPDPGVEDPDPGPPRCPELEGFRFEHGSPDGHSDPFGAKAAGQARAGRIRDASQIVQPPYARHKVRVGDFALANDRIALYIEAENRPSGYAPFGGEILAIEPVGEDGKPQGHSQYGETLVALSRQTVNPDKVTVIADGSDGKAAIVRVSGVLTNIPFLDPFRALMKDEYDFPAAIDYVLEPHAEKVTIRLHVANQVGEPIDFSKRQLVGFFHSHRTKTFTDKSGFDGASGPVPWVAFDGGDSGFLFRGASSPMHADVVVSGFHLFTVEGLTAEACETKSVDYLDIVAGGPGIDGVLEAKRRTYGEPAWRELRGTLRENGGGPLEGALIHATAPDGKYLTRARTNDAGEFVLHAPPGPVSLTPTLQGWTTPSAVTVAEGETTAELVLPQRATIEVDATDAESGEPIPVRVQIVPTAGVKRAPAKFGVREEVGDRLWQDFAVTGSSKLPVPPGEHRVIVSRGYEYELFETTVNVAAGDTETVEVALERSVDTTGVMCADFHIHTFYSVDAVDPIEEKVKGAIADGLDIPVSSDHEFVISFQPVIERLGLTKWAYGVPSQELTTFSWGHFGVVPVYPKEDQYNNGAVDWVGKTPDEVFRTVAELPENPVLIVNHPSSAGFGGYFSAAGFDRKKVSGDPELWSDRFGAIEVFNDSDFEDNRAKTVADWFALLNAGKTYWATGSSDSHDHRTSPVGYPRTCLRIGHDDPTQLTPEIVRDVLRSGAATVSGGLFMTAVGPSGVGPGGTTTAGEYKVVVQAPGFTSATSLEVIVDGVTTQTLPLTPLPGDGRPGKRYEVTVNVKASESRPRHWVVFHAKGDGDLAPLHPGRNAFAVTNPIFF